MNNTEDAEVHMVDKVVKVEDVINCVALYYEKGSSGTNYIRKEKFRAALPRDTKSLKKLRETVRLVTLVDSATNFNQLLL